MKQKLSAFYSSSGVCNNNGLRRLSRELLGSVLQMWRQKLTTGNGYREYRRIGLEVDDDVSVRIDTEFRERVVTTEKGSLNKINICVRLRSARMRWNLFELCIRYEFMEAPYPYSVFVLFYNLLEYSWLTLHRYRYFLVLCF